MDITYITDTLAIPLAAALHWVRTARRTSAAGRAVHAQLARERDEVVATLGERLGKVEEVAAIQLDVIMVRLDRIEEKIDLL